MSERTYGKATSEISCRPGETFVLELDGLPSAGYEWRVELDEELAKPVELAAEAPSEDFGAKTAQRFRIEPLKPGRTTIRLIYGRAWEAEPVETHTVELNVTPD